MSRKVSLTDAEQEYLLKLVQRQKVQPHPELIKKLTGPKIVGYK